MLALTWSTCVSMTMSAFVSISSSCYFGLKHAFWCGRGPTDSWIDVTFVSFRVECTLVAYSTFPISGFCSELGQFLRSIVELQQLLFKQFEDMKFKFRRAVPGS